MQLLYLLASLPASGEVLAGYVDAGDSNIAELMARAPLNLIPLSYIAPTPTLMIAH